MKMKIRRTVILAGVAASLVIGLMSIRVAAILTAAAAPPPAPPVSIETIRSDLAAEQARAQVLQDQLNELLSLTTDLSAALDSTGDQVSVDKLSAKQLRARLKAANAKLATMASLFKKAQSRLTALQQAADAAAAAAAAAPASATQNAPPATPLVYVVQQPTPKPTPKPPPTPKPSVTPKPSPTPKPIVTPKPTATPQPTPEPTPQPTPEPTPQPTPEPTPQPTPEPTPQPTPS
jgi:hypothetical protein